MALDSWVSKVRSVISTGVDSIRSTMTTTDAAISSISRRTTPKPNVGILAFEVASLMSKLLHLWRSLSAAHIARLRRETINEEGVRKLVSDDDAFLLGLACAELTETLRLVADSVSTLSKRCLDPGLRRFREAFKELAESGHDPSRWVMSWKEMDARAKKMDRYVASTAALYKEMDDLQEAEHGLRKLLQQCSQAGKVTAAVADVQQRVFWQRQEVKQMKQTSLWGSTFDAAVSLLARSAFTLLARINHAFGVTDVVPLQRSQSASVYPSSNPELGPTTKLLESSSAMLAPPETTLGAAALALHYANLIAVMEKMIRMPRAVGAEARDDLYGMLPGRVRGKLRARLRGVGWGAARDARLAEEWRAALVRIMEWLGPVASSTMRWQAERSFERRGGAMAAPRASVLLLQTLYFADREKVEAAIVELLVGLNYVWRFEREMVLSKACSLDPLLRQPCINQY